MKRRQLTRFGAEIKKALVDKYMTQRQLAETVGVSPQYLSHIIFGERPGGKYKQKIIDTLGIDPDKAGQMIA